jgi:hypothetical protein
MITAAETHVSPKASRARVWQAADRVLRSGRRPTVEGIRELLGGGSPNSITAYINDWYRELGTRLDCAEAPLAGLPADAVSLLTELWHLATTGRTGERASEGDTADRLRDAGNASLEAQTKALETLNQELQRHRASAERSLAETRALLARREAALDRERARTAYLEQTLAQTRLDLEVALELQRLGPVRIQRHSRQPSRLRVAKRPPSTGATMKSNLLVPRKRKKPKLRRKQSQHHATRSARRGSSGGRRK